MLKTFTKLLAPFAPFAAEDLYQKLRLESDPISVHLESWPSSYPIGDSYGVNVLENMRRTRDVVSAGLEARSRASVKIRQPLSELRIKNYELGVEYLELIKEEVNIKKVTVDESIAEGVALDTTITPELEEEGRFRDEIREIQDMRKEKGMQPGELLMIEIPAGKEDLYKKFASEIKKVTNINF